MRAFRRSRPPSAPHEISASSLQTLSMGHALWFPEPHESGEPEVGDVGFMKGGAFIRLFNLDTAADNKKVTFWDPPFEISDPPPPGCFKIDHRPPLAPAHYRSSGVQSTPAVRDFFSARRTALRALFQTPYGQRALLLPGTLPLRCAFALPAGLGRPSIQGSENDTGLSRRSR